jgi:hypothetical protein
MKNWQRWNPAALLSGAAVVAAYLIGSTAPVSADPPGCISCDCKDVAVWKVLSDNFGQGLVDSAGVPVNHGFSLCVLTCPNTPFHLDDATLKRRQYNNPSVTCNNATNPPSQCATTTQEASGTLTATVLGETMRAVCLVHRP